MRLTRRATLTLASAAAVTGVVLSAGFSGSAAFASAAFPIGGAPSTAAVSSGGHTWTPTLIQDFTKTAALGSFTSVYGTTNSGYSNQRDTSGNGLYSPNQVLSASGGTLAYNIRTVNKTPLVAAYMPSGYSSQTYGRYIVRMRSENLPGYKVAFNLWPSSNNWNDGEIDWPDGNTTGKAYPASAIVGSYTAAKGMTFEKPAQSTAPTMGLGWHDYTIEWSPGKVKWYFDDKLVGQTSNAAGVPKKPMRWTLQVETNNGGPAPAASVSGHVYVAWAAEYRY